MILETAVIIIYDGNIANWLPLVSYGTVSEGAKEFNIGAMGYITLRRSHVHLGCWCKTIFSETGPVFDR